MSNVLDPTGQKLDPATIISTITIGIQFAKPFALLTPTKVDDKAIAAVEWAITQPWFSPVLSALTDIYNSHTVLTTDEAIQLFSTAAKGA